MFKRIIAVFLAFVTIFLMVPFASADYTNTPVGFWDRYLLAGSTVNKDLPVLGSLVGRGYNILWGAIAQDTICQLSDDGYHHTPSISGCSTGKDEHGPYANATCQYCNGAFKVYSSDLNEAYQSHVATLPINSYSSLGDLIWTPTWSDISSPGGTFELYPWIGSKCVTLTLPFSGYTSGGKIFTPSSSGLSVSCAQTGDIALSSVGVGGMYFKVPADGTYEQLSNFCAAVSGVKDGAPFSHSIFYSPGVPIPRLAGDTLSSKKITQNIGFYANIDASRLSFSGVVYFPSYRVVLDTPPADVSTVYNINTRVQNNIVNEITNIYTNPTTGEEKTINDWIYNYNDRSYELHLADGMTVNVTFGDLNISIGETTVNENGDTIYKDYTVNYKVETTPDPSPSPSPSPSVPPTPDKPSYGPSRVFQNYNHKITQHYGNEGHNGVDVVPVSGVADTVIAHSEGEVVTVQTGQVNDTSATGAASWGNYVKILHPNGMYTLYAHLADVDVHEGDHVYRGQPLGLMGDTGRAFGAHLHFEVYEAETSRINPEPYLNADLPGMETEQDGWTWWKGAWSDFRSWLSGVMGKPDNMDTIFVPGVDSGGEGEEDSEWSFLDLLKAIVDGIWKFIKGIPGAIFGGLSGLIDGFVGIGDFFDAYGRNNPDGVFNAFTQGGEDLWD